MKARDLGFGRSEFYVRSYVLHPYKVAKDLRTAVEADPIQTLNGDLDCFLRAAIAMKIPPHGHRTKVRLEKWGG